MLRGFAVTQSSMTNYYCWGEKTMQMIKGENSSNTSEDLNILRGKITPEGRKLLNARSRVQKVKVDFFQFCVKER